MAIQNNKKVKRLAARIVLLTIIFFAGIQQSNGQKLDGDYRDNKTGDVYSQLSLMGSRFEFRVENPNVTIKPYVGKGYYLIAEDTLVLIYEPDPELLKSSYSELKIDSCELDANLQKSSMELGQYYFKVQDEEGIPIPSAQLFFFGRDGYLFSKATNRNGVVELVTGNKAIAHVTVRQLGYEALKIIPNVLSRNCLAYNITLCDLPNQFYKSKVTIERILIIKENYRVVGFQQLNSSRRWMRMSK